MWYAAVCLSVIVVFRARPVFALRYPVLCGLRQPVRACVYLGLDMMLAGARKLGDEGWVIFTNDKERRYGHVYQRKRVKKSRGTI